MIYSTGGMGSDKKLLDIFIYTFLVDSVVPLLDITNILGYLLLFVPVRLTFYLNFLLLHSASFTQYTTWHLYYLLCVFLNIRFSYYPFLLLFFSNPKRYFQSVFAINSILLSATLC